MTRLRFIGVAVSVLLAAVLVRGSVLSERDGGPPLTAASGERPEEIAPVHLSGTLTSAATALVTPIPGDSAGLVILLRAADLRTCEDLGRQLRSLRALPRAMEMVFMVEPGEMERTATFLRRERVRSDRLEELDPNNVVENQPMIPTPAVLIRGSTSEVTGLAYAVRTPNGRTRLLAADVVSLLPPAAEPDRTTLTQD